MNEYLVLMFIGATMKAEVSIVRSELEPQDFAEAYYEDPAILRVYYLAPVYKIGRDQFGKIH